MEGLEWTVRAADLTGNDLADLSVKWSDLADNLVVLTLVANLANLKHIFSTHMKWSDLDFNVSPFSSATFESSD